MRYLTLINYYLAWANLFLFMITMLSEYSMTANGDLVMKLTFNLINRKMATFSIKKAHICWQSSFLWFDQSKCEAFEDGL